MSPKKVLNKWIECFNKADFQTIAELYADDAVNHQVANEPVVGKQAIREMFKNEFEQAEMICDQFFAGNVGMLVESLSSFWDGDHYRHISADRS